MGGGLFSGENTQNLDGFVGFLCIVKGGQTLRKSGVGGLGFNFFFCEGAQGE